MKNSILLFGGSSDERLVSVASAQNLSQQFSFDELWFIHENGEISAVDKKDLNAHERPFEKPFAPTQAPFAKSIGDSLARLKGEIVFIGLHGTEGEDGNLQAMFEKEKIAFTGSGAKASYLCFEKIKAKQIVEAAKIPVAPQLHLQKLDYASLRSGISQFLNDHGRVVVKPVESGSSIGLHIVSSEREMNTAVDKMINSVYTHYLAEKFIVGRELTVGVLGPESELKALPPSEVLLQSGHSFDYEGKYLGRGTKEITPANLSETERQAAQKLAMDAHRALGCYGYSRTDMILTTGGPIFLETNTLPGLSKMSFVPQQLAAVGVSMSDFVKNQLMFAINR